MVFAVKHDEMSKLLKLEKKRKKKNPGENDDDYQDCAALQETLSKQTLSEAIKDAFLSSKNTHKHGEFYSFATGTLSLPPASLHELRL